MTNSTNKLSPEAIKRISKLTLDDWQAMRSSIWEEWLRDTYKEWQRAVGERYLEKIDPIIEQLEAEERYSKEGWT